MHKFVLVGVDDEGRQERRIMAERVLDWMGRADSKTREMRPRAMRVSVRGEWECECAMTNRDAVTASRRFWTRAGHVEYYSYFILNRNRGAKCSLWLEFATYA